MPAKTTYYSYKGDQETGRKLIGLANLQLEKLRNLMKFNGLKVYSHTLYNKTGAYIKVSSVHGAETAEIYYPILRNEENKPVKPEQLMRGTKGYHIWFDVDSADSYYPSLDTALNPLLTKKILEAPPEWYAAKQISTSVPTTDVSDEVITDVWHDDAVSEVYTGLYGDVTFEYIKWGYTATRTATYTFGTTVYTFTEVIEVEKYKYRIQAYVDSILTDSYWDDDNYEHPYTGWWKGGTGVEATNYLHQMTSRVLTATASCSLLDGIQGAGSGFGYEDYLYYDGDHYFFHLGKSYTSEKTWHPFIDVKSTFKPVTDLWYEAGYPTMYLYLTYGSTETETETQAEHPVLCINGVDSSETFSTNTCTRTVEYTAQNATTGATSAISPATTSASGKAYRWHLPLIHQFGVKGDDTGTRIKEIFILGIVEKTVVDYSDYLTHCQESYPKTSPYAEKIKYYMSDRTSTIVTILVSPEYSIITWDGANFTHYFAGSSGDICTSVIEVTSEDVGGASIEIGPKELCEWWYADPNTDWVTKQEK